MTGILSRLKKTAVLSGLTTKYGCVPTSSETQDHLKQQRPNFTTKYGCMPTPTKPQNSPKPQFPNFTTKYGCTPIKKNEGR